MAEGLTISARRNALPEHQPVLLREVVRLLALQPGDLVVDGTVGLGGHALACLERIGSGGFLVGVDRDPESLSWARHRLRGYAAQVALVQESFVHLPEILRHWGIKRVDRILLDLGLSLFQITSPRFSYQTPGPLDFRLDPRQELTAAEVVNTWPEEQLRDILRRYGEERWARRIARNIVQQRQRRPLDTTAELVEVVRGSLPPSARPRWRSAMSRVCQALRILVNDEIGALEQVLRTAPGLLSPGGRLAVISFHSLEARCVKRQFAALTKPAGEPNASVPPGSQYRLVTRKAVRPSREEMVRNRRARSATLRVLERME
ncbi:MAG TPA: 16S rRNA (cytosine(1402)-N(4))-methyltransferase RsmH [Armatimonadetes bacterium]|nr:16S rRNA (cytosine(1402)-N(4))-methyltransferase RsmH [Armatimonadota bacterium]